MRTYLMCGLCVLLGAAALVAEGQEQPKPKARPKAKAKTPAPPKETGPQLPELADAPVTNAYAFYSQASFDFVLDRHMRATFYPKEKGEHEGKPITMSAPLFSIPGAKGQPKTPAKIVEYLDPPAPKAGATEFTIEGKLSNDGLFGVKYKFSGTTLNLSCWMRNAPAAEGATPIAFEFAFAATHAFTPNIEMADRKKAVEGWYIKTREKADKEKNFKSYTYTYWDLAKFKKDAQSLEIFGPWGTRKFMIHEMGSGEGDLTLESPRGHRYPYAGYEAQFKVPTSAKKKTESTTLAIAVE